MAIKVPAFDLNRARRRIESELAERWQGILERCAFVLGPEVVEFERAFAAFLGAPGCVGVANGTDALTVSLMALGLRPGDEVLVPAFGFFATAEAVLLAGGTPVLADVEEATLNLDAGDAEGRVTARTVGVIGVHLYGCPCDLDRLRTLCERRGLWLMEDAAQAHGASWGGQQVGTFGQLAGWSFYPSKNLGCFGDGGAITGRDPDLLERARRVANHGQEGRYHHTVVGTNSRLDALQAAVLNCRLAHLEQDNARRRAIARRYRDELAGVGDLSFLTTPAKATPVYHQMTARTARRDALMEHLAERGIGTVIHYPRALHQQPALMEWMQKIGDRSPELPVAASAGGEVLCLPMFPELTDEEVGAVIRAVGSFFAS